MHHRNEELFQDGFAFSVFHFLWLADPLSGNRIKAKIPDTVQYKLGEPQLWYFTNSEGLVKRKGTQSLNKEKILENFLEVIAIK
jgi:hypothetical protein